MPFPLLGPFQKEKRSLHIDLLYRANGSVASFPTPYLKPYQRGCMRSLAVVEGKCFTLAKEKNSFVDIGRHGLDLPCFRNVLLRHGFLHAAVGCAHEPGPSTPGVLIQTVNTTIQRLRIARVLSRASTAYSCTSSINPPGSTAPNSTCNSILESLNSVHRQGKVRVLHYGLSLSLVSVLTKFFCLSLSS